MNPLPSCESIVCLLEAKSHCSRVLTEQTAPPEERITARPTEGFVHREGWGGGGGSSVAQESFPDSAHLSLQALVCALTGLLPLFLPLSPLPPVDSL